MENYAKHKEEDFKTHMLINKSLAKKSSLKNLPHTGQIFTQIKIKNSAIIIFYPLLKPLPLLGFSIFYHYSLLLAMYLYL